MKVAPKIGALGGMALGTGAQETGSIYNEQKEGEKDFGKAVATGVPAGLLETAGTMFGLKKSGLGKYIAEGLEEAPVKNWAGVGINLLKGGLGEAATEGSQNVLEQIGRQPGWNIPKDISNIKPMEVAENALGGFIMGGGMSGIGSAVEMKQNAYMDARNKAQQDIANGEAAAQGVSDKFAADVSTGVQSASLIDGAETIDEQARKQRDITKQETIAGDTIAAVNQTHEELENFNAGVDELSKPSYLMPNGQPAYTGSLESEIIGVNKAKTKLFSNHLGFAEKDLGITGLQIVDVKGDQSEVLQRIAQSLGRKVHYYVHENLQGEATAPEGFTNRNDPSRIFINARGSNSPIFIFGHEVAHTLASEMGGNSFGRLVSLLETGFDVEKYNNIIADAKQQKELAGLTDDGIKEEFTGNLFGEFLTKPHNLEALAAYNPTLFQKIAAIAIKVINKIKKAIGSLRGQYPTAANFVNDIDHVEAVIASVLNTQANIASQEGYEAKPYVNEDKLSYMKAQEDSSRRLEKLEGWLRENGVYDADINTDAFETTGKNYDDLTEQEKHKLLDQLPAIYEEANPHIKRNRHFDLIDKAETELDDGWINNKTLQALREAYKEADNTKNEDGISIKDTLLDIGKRYKAELDKKTPTATPSVSTSPSSGELKGVENKKPFSSTIEAPAANLLADITTKEKTNVHNKVYWRKVFGEIVPFEKFDEFAKRLGYSDFNSLQHDYDGSKPVPSNDANSFKAEAKRFMKEQEDYTRKRSYDANGNLLKDEYVETTPVKSKTAEERKANKILDDLTKPSVTSNIDDDPFESARERRDLKAYGTMRQQEDELSDSEYSDTAVADTIGLLVKQMAEANDWDLGPSKQKSKRSIPQMDYIPKQIEKRNEVFRRRNTESLKKIQDKTIIPERPKKEDVEKFKTIEGMINGIRGDWSTLESKRKSAEVSFKRENETSIKMAKKQIEESNLLNAEMYSGEGAEYIKGVKEDLLDMIDTIDKSGMYFPDVYKAVVKEQDIDSFSELIEMPQAMYRAFDQINNLSDTEEDAFTEEEAAGRKQEVSEKNKEQGVYYTKSKDTPVLKRQPVRQATDEEKEKIKAAAKNYVSSTTMKSKPIYEQWKASNATPKALKKIGKAIIEYVEEKRFDRQMTHYATDMIKDISEKLGVSERDVSNALRLMTIRVKDAAIPESGAIKEEADYRVSNALEKNRWPKAIDNQDQFKPAQDKYHDLVRVLDLINSFGRQGIIEATFYDGEGGTYTKEMSVSMAQRNANRRLDRKDSSPQKGDIVDVKIPNDIKQAHVFASEMFGEYEQVYKLIDAAVENEVNGKPAPLAQEDIKSLKDIMQEIDTVKAELANSSSEITRLKKEQEAIVKKAKADANGAAVKMPTEFYKSKEALKKVEALPKTTREKIAELEAKAKEHIIAIKTALFEQQVDKMQGITPEFIEETAAKTGLTEQKVFEIAHNANYDKTVMTSRINRAVAIQRQEKFDAVQEGLNSIAKKNNGVVTSEDVQNVLDKNNATAEELINPSGIIIKPSYTQADLADKLGKIAEANHQAIQKGAAQKEQASDTKKVFGKLTIPKKIKNTDEKDDAVFEKANKPNVADPVFEEAGEATSFQEELVNTLTSLATQKRDAGLPVASHDIFVADKTQYEKAPLISGVESSDNYMVGRLRSGFAQSVFTKIANAFDADLVVVRDFSGYFNGMYIPKGKNGRAKLVINVDSKTSFTHLFAHELFHHVINRISASAANILQAAIDKSVDKSLYEKAKKKVFYDYTNLSDISKADQAMLQEEVNAEIFATAFKQPEFWDELSKTEEGKSVARRLIFRGLKNIASVMKVLNSLGRGEQSIFEIDKLVKEWYGKDGVYQALAKVVNEALDSKSPLRHNSVKYSAFEHGKVAANEAKTVATSIWEKIAAFFRRIFPKGTKSYKEVMQNIEDIAGESLDWIKKHKPAGIYEDLGADPMDMFLVGKVAFDPAWDVKKAEAAVEKYKEVWKGMTDLQLEKLHDAVVRKKDITGLTDEQKAAFEAYKEIADGIWERLSKIYPDLKKRESHYGQSIKWLFNNGIAMEKDINEEASRLLGNDRFTKEKAENKTTRQIAEEMNLKYETINPHELLMNYVYDSAKLIGLHEMLQEGMVQNKVFFLDDNDAAAKRKGLRPVSDAAMKVMKDMTVSEGYVLQKNGKDIVDDDSLETLKFDSLEEAQKHLEENPIEGARVVAKTSSKSVVGGKYYFADRLGAMLETLVAKDAVRNFEAFGYSGHQVMDLKNKMTAVEMALSLFHAVTISHEFNSSTFANRMQQGGSVFDMAKSLNIFANIKAAKQTSKLMNMLADPDSNKEELKEKLKTLLHTDSDEVLNVLEYYYRSGGEQGMDKDFQTSTHKKAKMKYGSWDEMKGSVKEVWDKEIANNPDKRFKAMFNTAEFAALEAPTAWLMEDGIPMLKLSLFGTEFVFEVGKKEKALGRKLTDQEKQKVAWDVMKFVGDRMGEVNWKTQFMLPNVKTALQFAMRSYTWVSGNIIALGKSGHAFTEYGWAKLKGDKDAKLSPYGYWGISAIFNHFLAASLITASYTLSRLALGYEEAPDDPETSLITKAIFPRISAHDPTKRLAIPSYVTESYKILSHLGLTGHKAEPFKLISGRFNSLVSNLVDVLKNENWRGVNIRDKDENIVKQLVDVAAHMMVVPISFSTIVKEYKETGEIARPVATGIMGMTSAPASAIRSKATQRAFELRRSEYKGRETTEDMFEESQALKRAMYAYSKGDSSKIEQLKKEGRVSQRQYDIAITRIPLINGKPNPKYIDQLAQAVKGLTINGALEVWEEMSDAEKTKHRGEIKKKYFNMLSRKDKPEAEKTKIKQKMKELNLI